MAADPNSFPQQVAQTVYAGVITDVLALADNVCSKYTQSITLNGTLPRRTSKSGTGRIKNRKLAPGVAAQEHGGEMAGTDFKATAHVGTDFISDESLINGAAYNEDELAKSLTTARMEANLNVDATCVEALGSTTLNIEFDCQTDGAGSWNDYTNSTPLSDLRLGRKNFAPGSDTIIMGTGLLYVLLDHPAFFAGQNFFNAGALDFEKFETVMRAKIPGIRNVYLWEKIYDANELGQAVDFEYLFDYGCWVGHKSDLVLVEPASELQGMVDQERVVGRRGYKVSVNRYIDVVRPTREKGVIFTNPYDPA
jgi:hypothetical protein